MKDVFIFWIFLQLVVIGWSAASMQAEIKAGEFECSTGGEAWTFWDKATLTLIPLVFFANTDWRDEYCEKKEGGEK